MPKLSERLKRIRLLLTDVDGVLTDGRLYHFFDAKDRFVEVKGVDTQDGIALAWLARAGVETGIISGRKSRGLAQRAKILSMKHVVQGTLEKEAVFLKILKKLNLLPQEAAFMGDDLPDAPVMRLAGWAIAPANARPEIKRIAHTVTKARGGAGAMREAAEMLLRAKGKWKSVLKEYGF